ncbi:hypothetical protein L1D22_00545 [Vibrio sp. Isolate34]|uniref:hypothetical protein n=1 Tax=Vibrio sp. Isolate34 TaxID=2908540 RepID=UPI001EFE5736|nr:hypothetical protein [Vibrio sp. Isolate34]MCG9638441.1 hypothetical protein [Vibrio sp. Isolate34]
MVKFYKTIAFILLLTLQACSSLPASNSLTSVTGVQNMEQALADLEDPQKQANFTQSIKHVVDVISSDSGYQRIPIDTPEEQEWFTARAFLLWDGMITQEQFVKFGIERFPQYKSSFSKVASLLEK